MGVASLKGLQFYDRLLIMLMPVKYQPDYMFLRQVKLRKEIFKLKVFLNNFNSNLGPNQESSSLHLDSINLSDLPLAD